MCSGCYRTIDEIAKWPNLSEAEQTEIAERCQIRKSMTKLLAFWEWSRETDKMLFERDTYELDDAPLDVLSDVNRHSPHICEKCGLEFSADVKILEVNTKLTGFLKTINQLRLKSSWHSAQTFQSLKPNLLSETREVVKSMDQGNFPALCDELGDLLFHVVFYSKIAEELGYFNLTQVVDSINKKMIRRHPHIFSDQKYANETEREADYERIKSLEPKPDFGLDFE